MDTPPSAPSEQFLAVTSVILLGIFLAGWILGIRGPILIANDKCYELLGCNMGFFGYDAALHFVSGIMDAVILIWLMRIYPSFSLFHDRFWKNFLMIIALTALISVSWEFGELCHDQYRMKVLHEDLTTPDRLDQPTNDDTMGDMTFSIIGAAIAVSALKPLVRKK